MSEKTHKERLIELIKDMGLTESDYEIYSHNPEIVAIYAPTDTI
jgi:hypothetical protein